MAKLYVGKNNAIPVRNAVSMHGDDIVDILNNEDLSNALDGKVDKVSTPSILYGTDSNGQQTTYDLSLLFDTETAPDGYTDVEYITSSDESTKSVRIRDYHAETPSFMGFEIVDAGKFMDYFNTILAVRYDYPITCVKFQVENPSTSGAPMLWYLYVNAQGGTEPTMRNGGSVYEEPYDGMDSIEQRWGIRPIYSDTTSREEGDSGTFDIYEVSASGQYIDTGINITKYNIGAVLYNEEQSTCADPTATHTSTPDSTDWYIFKGKMNNATTTYGEEITQFRFKITNVASTLFSVEIYANDKEVAYETYTDTTTDSLRGQYGVILSGNMTVGDEYVFYLVGRIQDTYAVETSIKLSDYQISQAHNGIFGSISQSGNFGCGLRCSENDGILFKHYVPNVQSGFAVPYNKGNWNNIKIEPGLFTLNGESYSLDSGDIRTVSGKTFILFGISNENGISVSGMSMKRTKIYKNGNLVFNGIPCVEDSSSIAGMYDLVTQQFFKSAKEGAEFIAGPVKENSSETNLGIEGENVLVGLDKEGKISAYTGKNGIIIEGTIGIDDYEELEYIESGDGTLAFDTKRHWGESGYNINSAKWEITYNQVKTSAASSGTQCQYVFGDGMFSDMGQNFNRIDFRFFRGLGSFPYTSNNGNTGAGVDDGIFLESLNTWNTFAFDYKKLYLNNVVIKELDSQISSTVHNKNFHIFNAPNAITSGEFGDGFIGKISKVTLIVNRGANDNVTMAKFVPVRRKSDNEIGFYDTVNGIFCQNIGEGTPIAGPIKTGTISLEKSLDSFLENIATQKDTSLMVTTPTVPGSGTVKNLSGSSDLVIGPYGEITDGGSNSIAINGKVTGSGAIVIGKNSSISAGHSVVVGNEVEVDGSNSVVVGYSGTSSTSFKVGSYSVILGNEIQTAKRSGVVAIGHHAYAYNGDNLIAIGHSAASYGNLSVSIGYGAQSLNSYCVVLGANARTNGDYGIAIGNTSSNADENRTLAYEYSIALGSKARATGSNSVVIGKEATASGDSSVCIGASATTGSISTCVAVGANSIVNGGWGTALGYNASASESAVAVGRGCQASGTNNVAIGRQCSTTGANSIAMGHSARSTNNNEVALGTNAQADGGGSIAIGESAKAGNRSTAVGGMCSAIGSAAIAIGHASSTVNANEAIAIGLYAKAPNSHAVALGYKAETSAIGAIQLGEGTNTSQNTLKFMSYPLVQSDGIIPYERLTPYAPTNGYVLAWSTSTNSLVWVENGEGGGGYELPIASASTLGGVKIGDGLEIDSETGVLSVVEQPSGGEGTWGSITGDINDQTDLKAELDTRVQQFEEMPTASRDYNERVVQFTGISDLLYDHGFFYECQYRKVSEIDGSTSDDSRFGVTFDVPRFEKYLKVYENYEVQDGDSFVFEMRGDGDWYITLNGDDFTDISPNNLPYMGVNVILYGSAEIESGDEIYVDYLAATNPDSHSGYIWTQIAAQPQHNVIDNVTSTSTTDALSANQGRLLSDRIDSISAIGTFLAIWDCNRTNHNARYLTDGYSYSRGNYFIVGTVDSWSEAKAEYHSSTAQSLSMMMSSTQKEPVTYYNATTDETHTITWDSTKHKWVDELGNEFTHAGSGSSSTWDCLGFTFVSSSQVVPESSLTNGDSVTINIVFPHNYMPDGSTYDETGSNVRTYDDVQVSDMYFYDGSQWILLANHNQSIPIDHEMDPNSKNPAENRAIYSALQQKVSTTRNTNRLYGTDAYRSQTTYELGTGLAFEEGKLVNTLDLSTKQDVLVDSGEDQNIKTINGESILGSGNIVIQGGSGEGIGTINISNVFCKDSGLWDRDDYTDDLRSSYYKGSYSDIFFTVNAPLDYVKEHRNDLYVTYSRRNQGNGLRKWRLLNDNRIKTNVKMYCWRFRTNQVYNSSFEVWENDYDQNYQSDETYIYFYTTSNYNDDMYDMYDDNPLIWYSDLRHVGDDFEDDNFSQGCWGTCFNELTEYGNITDRWDDVDPTEVFERCQKYDITDVVMDTQVEYNPDNSNIWLDKMKGRLYQDNDGNKLYTWSNEWWLDNGRVFAYLDDNDEPIFNRIPSDMSKLSQICQVSQLTTLGYTLVEERPDLTYRRFNLNQTSQNIRNFVNNCRDRTTDCHDQGGNPDLNWRCYFWDYPVQPVRLAECKIFFADEAPFLPGPDFPNDRFSDYTNRAYTLEEIEADEDLTYMLENQHQLIFVLPYDTYYLWMRTLGWTKMVYTHAHVCSEWNSDEEYWEREISRWDYEWYYDEEWDRTYPVPKYDPDTGEQLKVRYEGDQGEDPNYEWLLAQPWDRHNLNRALSMGGQRNLGYYCNGTTTNRDTGGMGDFDNRCGILQGTPGYPRWSMRRGTKYFLPIQINIITGKELSHGNTSKSTPFNVKLSITGDGNQSMYSD